MSLRISFENFWTQYMYIFFILPNIIITTRDKKEDQNTQTASKPCKPKSGLHNAHYTQS